MERIIGGGVFALAAGVTTDAGPDRVRPGLPFRVDAWFASGRAAIAAVIAAVSPRQTWIPAYTCSSVIDAVMHAGSSLRFHPAGADPDEGFDAPWLHEVGPADLVVVIDQHGFRPSGGVWERLAETGAFVLEDASPAFLTAEVGTHADAVIRSPRKYVGVPDGGLLAVTSSRLGDPPSPTGPAVEDTTWFALSLGACRGRADFDAGARDDRTWVDDFRTADSTAPLDPVPASALTRDLLAGGIDYDAMARRRRRSYARCAERLGPGALGRLPDGVVPQHFGLWVDELPVIKQRLFLEEIYPPGPWARDERVPPEFAVRAYEHLLLLPIDHRYGDDDIDRMTEAVHRALG